MKRIYNVQTNPVFLPLYGTEEVMYEAFEERDGAYVKVYKKRRESRIKETKMLEGTHHEKMHQPAFIDVSEKDFEAIARCPNWPKLLESGQIRYENAPKDSPKD